MICLSSVLLLLAFYRWIRRRRARKSKIFECNVSTGQDEKEYPIFNCNNFSIDGTAKACIVFAFHGKKEKPTCLHPPVLRQYRPLLDVLSRGGWRG